MEKNLYSVFTQELRWSQRGYLYISLFITRTTKLHLPLGLPWILSSIMNNCIVINQSIMTSYFIYSTITFVIISMAINKLDKEMFYFIIPFYINRAKMIKLTSRLITFKSQKIKKSSRSLNYHQTIMKWQKNKRKKNVLCFDNL